MSKLLSNGDYLAIERTRLANERTFLAYFRSFVVILSSGIAIMKLKMLEEVFDLGIGLVILAPIILFIGLGRLLYTRRRLKKFYSPEYLAPEQKKAIERVEAKVAEQA